MVMALGSKLTLTSPMGGLLKYPKSKIPCFESSDASSEKPFMI